MRQVFVAQHPIEAHFVKDLLASAGIAVVIRGEHLFALRGGVPMTEDTLPSVWVVYDDDFERAREIVRRQEARARLRSVPPAEGAGSEEESEEDDADVASEATP